MEISTSALYVSHVNLHADAKPDRSVNKSQSIKEVVGRHKIRSRTVHVPQCEKVQQHSSNNSCQKMLNL